MGFFTFFKLDKCYQIAQRITYPTSNFHNDEKINWFQQLLLLPAVSRFHAPVASNHFSENDRTKIFLIFLGSMWELCSQILPFTSNNFFNKAILYIYEYQVNYTEAATKGAL